MTNVSTHSRPKAAGFASFIKFAVVIRFNTQPPEGGWSHRVMRGFMTRRFNTQPPEGGWVWEFFLATRRGVSTHSRPKAAGIINCA